MIDGKAVDRTVAAIMTELGTDSFDVERLLRLGAHGVDSVVVAAGRLGMSKHWIADKLRGHGMPGPKTLLAWGRLSVAMSIQRSSSLKLDAIARAVGYANAYSMSDSTSRYLGMSPRAWRDRGGDEAALGRHIVGHWRARGEEPRTIFRRRVARSNARRRHAEADA